MIDYESLLEFESSLESCSDKKMQIVLENLEVKIEMNQEQREPMDDEFTVEELDRLYEAYDITKDEFATCVRCGQGLGDTSIYKSCCRQASQKRTLTGLEKSYWMSFINNPSRTINTLPRYTELLFFRQGIPSELRQIVWKKVVIFNSADIPETSRLVYQNFQHSYNHDISEQINKDLNRTFPHVAFFKEPKHINDLSTILNVYANYDAELGYCQGLLFLVSVLYYQLKGNSELTFHTLISIMESEYELHDIFTPDTMSFTLDKWHTEFMSILGQVDKDLFVHLDGLVEASSFLYQWWLSFASIHTPDLSIINRIVDFCILQGWKVGLLKISLGLLLVNKDILLQFSKGDEEVIYQHLLNESKWGRVVNDIDMFFGNTLLSLDDDYFLQNDAHQVSPVRPSKINSSILQRIGKLSLSLTRNRSDSDATRSGSLGSTQSSASVFSTKVSKGDTESLYSEISEVSESKSITDFLKIPSLGLKSSGDNLDNVKMSSVSEYDPVKENDQLRSLLKRAYDTLESDTENGKILKSDIAKALIL